MAHVVIVFFFNSDLSTLIFVSNINIIKSFSAQDAHSSVFATASKLQPLSSTTLLLMAVSSVFSFFGVRGLLTAVSSVFSFFGVRGLLMAVSSIFSFFGVGGLLTAVSSIFRFFGVGGLLTAVSSIFSLFRVRGLLTGVSSIFRLRIKGLGGKNCSGMFVCPISKTG